MLGARQGEGHPQLPHLRRSRRPTDIDPAHAAVHTRVDKLPTRARLRLRARGDRRGRAARPAPTSCAAVLRADPLYEGGEATARAAADLPRQSRCRAASRCSSARPFRKASDDELLQARHARPCDAADAARRADDLFGRRAGLRRRRRRPGCARGHVRQQGRGLQRQQAARHDHDHRRRRTSTPTTRCSARSPSWRASARSAPRADPRPAGRCASPATSPACSRCRASIPATGAEMLIAFNTSTAAAGPATCWSRPARRASRRSPAPAPPPPPRRAASRVDPARRSAMPSALP